MALYATAAELASYLQQDLDTSTATLALTLASDEFRRVADTAFAATSITWAFDVDGCTTLEPPYHPITAVSQVRVNGSIVTGWSLRNNRLYRAAGFGYVRSWPPDFVEVDLTYGYTTVPDAVKLAVLEIAAGLYEHPSQAVSESVDDYTVRYDPTVKLTAGRPWRDVAADYRNLLVG